MGKRVTAIYIFRATLNFVRFWAKQICRSSAPLQVKVLHVYNISKPAPVQLGIRLFLFSNKFNSCGNCSFGTLSWINSRQVAGESVTTALPFTANRSSLRCSFSEIRSFLSTVLPYFELLVPSLNFAHFWAKHLPRDRNAEPLHNHSMYM